MVRVRVLVKHLVFFIFCMIQAPTPPLQSYTSPVPCLLLPPFPPPLLCPPISTAVPTPPGVTPPTPLWLPQIPSSALPPMACSLPTTRCCISNLARLRSLPPWPLTTFPPRRGARLCPFSPPLTARPKSRLPTSCCLLICLPLTVAHSLTEPQSYPAPSKGLFSVNVVSSNTTRGLPAASRLRNKCPAQSTPYRGSSAPAVKWMYPISRTPVVKTRCPAVPPQNQSLHRRPAVPPSPPPTR